MQAEKQLELPRQPDLQSTDSTSQVATDEQLFKASCSPDDEPFCSHSIAHISPFPDTT